MFTLFFVILYYENLHSAIFYQVFLSNTNNLYKIVWFQVFLYNTHIFQKSIWLIYRTLKVIDSLGLSGYGSHGNEGVTPHTHTYIYIYIYIYINGSSLKLVDKFTYLGSCVSSTEKDVDTRLTKGWTVINRLSVIWKSDLTDKMKHSFFQAAIVSILLYGCTTWTLTKRLKKKLDGNYTRMLRAILNRSWFENSTKQQLYGQLPPITKTIQIRRTRHTGHCWRSRDELISDVLLWTPSHSRAKVGQPARTYTQQLSEDMGCSPEDLLEAMNDRKRWRERVRDICADGTTRWWWWYTYYNILKENICWTKEANCIKV